MPKTNDNTAELILEQLRSIRADIAAHRKITEGNSREISMIRRELLGLRQDILNADEWTADQIELMKDLSSRVERLERQAELEDTLHDH